MTAKEMRGAEVRYRRAFRRYEAEREARNDAIRAALAIGWTHAQISEATGLSRARIGQLALTPPQARSNSRHAASDASK